MTRNSRGSHEHGEGTGRDGGVSANVRQRGRTRRGSTLLRKLARMPDVQATFQIFFQSVSTLLAFLLRIITPENTATASQEFDALVEWALPSIIAGEVAEAEAVGSGFIAEVESDPGACGRENLLGDAAVW